jgi:ferritin-like metal-binding protein YciE
LEDLLAEQVKDLYDAEHRLVEALPKMADAASSIELQDAFLDHLEQTKNHAARLEQAFDSIGVKAERETCQAMKGLVSEGSQAIHSKGGNPAVRDAALIATAQRVEHYEMAGYGSARTFAEQLGFSEAADLLESTLEEERQADSKLTTLALLFALSGMRQFAPTRFSNFDMELRSCVFNACPGLVPLCIGDIFDLVEAGDGVTDMRGAVKRLFALFGKREAAARNSFAFLFGDLAHTVVRCRWAQRSLRAWAARNVP